MIKEVVAGLSPKPGDNVIDATIGGGGHAEAILKATGPNGKLLGIDWDKQAIARTQERLAPYKNRVILKAANYIELPNIIRELNFTPVNGIILDLGLSSDQLTDNTRGFSFNANGPLDMRFSDQSLTTASQIVNTWSEEELAHIFHEYGEERHAARIARLIVASRRRAPIASSLELANLVRRGVGRRGGRIHPATRIFQALRLAVNSELENIAHALPLLAEILSPGGRIAVISFHSLEDRIVKRLFKQEGLLQIINKHVIKPGREEILANAASRSAKLRIAQRVLRPSLKIKTKNVSGHCCA
jgi:16S rRNA (cytosine1402-N4)-methyltransferase